MSITASIQAAIDRLGKYNTGEYNPTANPYGLSGEGGTDANFDQLWRDVTTVSAYLGGLVNDINVVSERAAVATILQQAQALVAQITVGSANALSFPAVDKALMAVTDIVDVFVYDTRLDDRLPDGGRWNEPGRCSNTSWWNEALNTATRGGKRDFPLVALIVAQPTRMTIYDALELDPTSGAPRLWMVFNGGGSRPLEIGDSRVITSVYARNGNLYFTVAGPTLGNIVTVNFATDTATSRVNVGLSGLYVSANRIVDRNVTNYYASIAGSGILAGIPSGVYARVLPGAPLDAAGMPVPTVLVVGGGGGSVIHPTGQVANLADTFGFPRGWLLNDGRIALTRGDQLVLIGPVPYAAATAGVWAQVIYTPAVGPAVLNNGAGNAIFIIDGAEGGAVGLTLRAHDAANPANGMVSYVTNNYATGWQPGAMRLATLCDAATGSVTGSGEMVTNGGFGAGATGWTLGAGWIISGGAAVKTAGTASYLYQLLALSVGSTYAITFTVSGMTTGTITPLISGTGQSTGIGVSANGTYTQYIIAPTGASWVGFHGTATFDGSVDNISIKLAVPDRSYKAKGLVVNGTLIRAAVAAGAEMVAWSGFSASNYLEQPYNTDLDFTGDFAFFWWQQSSDVGGYAFSRTDPAFGGSTVRCYLSGGTIIANVKSGAVDRYINGPMTSGKMQFCGVVQRGNVSELWVDGRLVGTSSSGTYAGVSNASATLRLGCSQSGIYWIGALSLFRATAYAPSPAQVRKMYADEAPLFQAGAKCLLGGASNNVTKLDRDPLTDRLLVCADAGSSIFQGLVRAAYHTSSTIISATNNNHRTGSLRGGVLLLGTAAQAATFQAPVDGKEAIAAGGFRPAAPPFRSLGTTTDATPTDLAPRVSIGERELVTITATILGRVYGAADGQRSKYIRRGTYYRDAGGAVTLQGAVEAIGTDQEVAATADATLNVDTSAQTVSVRVTGVAATRISWVADIQITRISEDQTYA